MSHPPVPTVPWGAMPPPQPSFFTVDLRNSIGSEYVPVVEDILRMVCVQFTIQLMLYFNGAADGIFTLDVLCIISYVIVGVLLYWLILRPVVKFR